MPIQFNDYTFSSRTLTDLEAVFNGNGEEDTGYWESLSSFYQKSSFGEINLTFEIADVYEAGMSARDAYRKYGTSNDYGRTLIEAAFNTYKKNNGTTHLDGDNDGFVDAVIGVYSCYDYYTGEYSWDKNSFYWAYTYWFQGYNASGYWVGPNSNDPALNAYIWLSYDFMYEAVSSPKVDAHTLIHETGHLFGLDDYYSSDGAPSGGFNMMDLNTHDHDVWSKLALGWANPKVPTGDCTITLTPSQEYGDCILLPTSSWNGSLWDEYLIIELYTPTGLNYQDAKHKYLNLYPSVNGYGIKLFHVDARIAKCTATKNQATQSWEYSYSYLEDLDDFQINWEGNTWYEVASSNCFDSLIDEDFELIHLIEATGVNSFSKGNYATKSTLFGTGDSFEINTKWSKFFPNGTTMNNGDSFPWRISFDEVSEESATITITAV